MSNLRTELAEYGINLSDYDKNNNGKVDKDLKEDAQKKLFSVQKEYANTLGLKVEKGATYKTLDKEIESTIANAIYKALDKDLKELSLFVQDYAFANLSKYINKGSVEDIAKAIVDDWKNSDDGKNVIDNVEDFKPDYSEFKEYKSAEQAAKEIFEGVKEQAKKRGFSDVKLDGDKISYTFQGKKITKTIDKNCKVVDTKVENIKNGNVTDGKADASKTGKYKSAEEAAKVVYDDLKAKAEEKGSKKKISLSGNKITIESKNKTVVKTIDINGNVAEEKVTKGKGDNKTTTTTKYGENGKPTEEKVVKGKGKKKSVSISKFDENGVITDKETTIGKGKNKEVITIKYENGIIASKEIKLNDATCTIKYNEKGKPTSKISKDENGKKMCSIKYTYDKDGHQESKTEDIPGYKQIQTSYGKKKENKDGTYTRTKTKTVTEDGVERTYTSVQTFNKDNKLISTEVKNEDGRVIKQANIERDKEGNIVSQTIHEFYADGSETITQKSNFEVDDAGINYDWVQHTKNADGTINDEEKLSGSTKDYSSSYIAEVYGKNSMSQTDSTSIWEELLNLFKK